jgi:GntR family transcriptional repressor for pyruvate dehydrogenase complex
MSSSFPVEDVTIRPPTLRAVVADRLEEAIAAGEFAEGEYLPPEPELCRRFGVSRTVVREALGTLEARGLVAVQHGRGAVVLPNRAPAVSSLLRFEWRAGRGTPSQLLEARRVLETAVARLAAARATEADVETMAQALRDMAVAQTPEAYITADLSFHTAIVRAAGNPILGLLNDALAELLRASRRQTYFIPGAVASSLRDHRLVYERIAAGDAEGAEREMAAVLDQVERHITEAGLAPDLAPPAARERRPAHGQKHGTSGRTHRR